MERGGGGGGGGGEDRWTVASGIQSNNVFSCMWKKGERNLIKISKSVCALHCCDLKSNTSSLIHKYFNTLKLFQNVRGNVSNSTKTCLHLDFAFPVPNALCHISLWVCKSCFGQLSERLCCWTDVFLVACFRALGGAGALGVEEVPFSI